MNASPARKNSRCVTSTAAAMLRISPVIEIAFGVKRDSISRSRANAPSSWALRGRRGSRVRRGRVEGAWTVIAVPTRSGGGLAGRLLLSRSPRPARRAHPPKEPVGGERREAGDGGPGRGVEPVVVGGDHDHEEEQQRVRGPEEARAGAPGQQQAGHGDHEGEGDVHAWNRRV